MHVETGTARREFAGPRALPQELAVLIPAYNEHATLPSLLAEVREVLPDSDIIVISDGSADATVRVAREGRRSSICPAISAWAAPCRRASGSRWSGATGWSCGSTATASIPRRKSRGCWSGCGGTRPTW
ncbi:MAG: glycosyltransferase [Kiritimatiellia bacterium]